jgi:glycosyltransferase involved in cell wall biosynthesis
LIRADSERAVPRISVVVPAYNRRATIGRAISSVLQQSVEDFEVIVVDDGSTDLTADFVLSFVDDRVRLVRQVNSGPSAARNRGAAVACAAVVTFLDSDDEAQPGWLEVHLRNLGGAEDVGISCVGIVRQRSDGGTTVILPGPLGALYGDVVGLFITGGTFACRNELFQAVGGFDEQLWYGENTELAVRLIHEAQDRSLTVSSSPAALITQYWDVSRAYAPRVLAEAAERFLDVHRQRLATAPDIAAAYLSVVGVNRAKLQDYSAAKSALWTSWRLRPTDLRRLGRVLIVLVPLFRHLVWTGRRSRCS